MQRDCTIAASVKRAQQTMFREAEKIGITHKVIHFDTGGDHGGLSLSAIGQYARGESAMGLPSLVKLIGVVPANLLSLLLPDGFQIVRVPEGIDHDKLAELASDYLTTKNAAHHPASEAGRDLGPGEQAALGAKAVCLKVAA